MDSPRWQPLKLGGVCLDLVPPNVPGDKWTFAGNFHFKENAAERSGGYLLYHDFPAGSRVVFMLNAPAPETNWWIAIVEASDNSVAIWVYDGQTWTDKTGTHTLTSDAIWTGCILNGIPVINSSLDGPLYWDLNLLNDFLALPGWDVNWRCVAMRAFQYHLFALNMTEGAVNDPHKFRWSESADPLTLPQSWTAAPDNDAGDGYLITTPGVILDGAKLRDQFILYKSDSTYILRYVAGAFVFDRDPLFDSSGIQATDCVVEDVGYHYVLTDTDVIRHDGQTLESVATWSVKDTLLNNITPDEARFSQVISRQDTDEIWVAVSQNSGLALDAVYVYNHITGEWGLRGLPDPTWYIASGIIERSPDDSWDTGDPVTWDENSRRWNAGQYSASVPGLLLGNDDVWEVDAGPNDTDGNPVSAFLERTGIQVSNERRQLVTAIYPEITGNPGQLIKVRVGGHDYFDNPVNWRGEKIYELGKDDRVDALVQERYLAVRFESDTGGVWKLHGMKVETRNMGIY